MLLKQITTALQKSLEANGVVGVPVVLSPSKHADFQCNAVIAAAKKTGRDPSDVAKLVLYDLAQSARLPGVGMTISGNGFINIHLQDSALAKAIDENEIAPKPSDGPVVYLDFGGPNVAKPMHVGHLRSLVIGDSLQRILRFTGYNVVSDIHLGDFGLQMGLLLAHLEGVKEEDVTLEMLEEAYPLATKRAKTDQDFKDKAQKLTAIVQSGYDNHVEVEKWKRFIKVSMESVYRDVSDLGVLFTLYKGESDAQPQIPRMIAMLHDAGMLEDDDGTQITRACEPPMVLITSAGTALYSLTDLTTILQRKENRKAPADRIIYVVDQRQSLHFQQLFEVSDKVGLMPKDKLTHVGFGTVNGTDGRPLKTRDGGSHKLHDLIETAKAKAAERNPDGANEVAMAALKFADLQNLRMSSYTFDLDRFLSFEGKTGPYLLYQCVRIKKLLAASEIEPGPVFIGSPPEERALALMLAVGFEAALNKAVSANSPKEIADFAYDLAQAFSSFYAACPISGIDYRLGLAKHTLHQLETALDLLGIEVPEAM